METERTRQEMMRLVRNEFDNNPLLVSRALGATVDKRVSPRTVQAWLIDPEKSSSRTCPNWALKALRDFLSDPARCETLAMWREVYNDGASGQAEFRRTYERDSVERATREIESDARALTDWENASLLTMSRKLFEFERRTVAYLRFLHDQQIALIRGLEQAKSYEELRTIVLEVIRDKESTEAYVLQTRRAIEGRTNEFAHPEGLVD